MSSKGWKHIPIFSILDLKKYFVSWRLCASCFNSLQLSWVGANAKCKMPNAKRQTPNTKHQTTNNKQQTPNNKQIYLYNLLNFTIASVAEFTCSFS